MRRAMTAMTSLLIITSLSGCVETTQQKSARLGLIDDRLLASQQSVRVTRADPQVSVLGVASVTRGSASAVAVTLRNDAARPLSDLAISVGVTSGGGRRIYLNAAAGLPYFQTHVGAIAPGGAVTWVFTRSGRLAAGARPFALVGAPTVTDQAGAASVPSVTVSAGRSRGGILPVTVTNHSGVPQVGLALYASATSGQRLLAAGQASLAQLDPGDHATVPVAVVGATGPAPVSIDAPPTNLR